MHTSHTIRLGVLASRAVRGRDANGRITSHQEQRLRTDGGVTAHAVEGQQVHRLHAREPPMHAFHVERWGTVQSSARGSHSCSNTSSSATMNKLNNIIPSRPSRSNANPSIVATVDRTACTTIEGTSPSTTSPALGAAG